MENIISNDSMIGRELSLEYDRLTTSDCCSRCDNLDASSTQHHHLLTNDQFKQKLDCLKRRQRMLLKNLHNCLERADNEKDFELDHDDGSTDALSNNDLLELKGVRCNLERTSRSDTPVPLLCSHRHRRHRRSTVSSSPVDFSFLDNEDPFINDR